jgi:hypothetical protein
MRRLAVLALLLGLAAPSDALAAKATRTAGKRADASKRLPKRGGKPTPIPRRPKRGGETTPAELEAEVVRGALRAIRAGNPRAARLQILTQYAGLPFVQLPLEVRATYYVALGLELEAAGDASGAKQSVEAALALATAPGIARLARRVRARLQRRLGDGPFRPYRAPIAQGE